MQETEETEHTGILLSLSATTGWLDWMHGELWQYPDGLLRIPRGWLKTFLSNAMFFSARKAPPRTIDSAKFAHLIADRRNLWIPFDAVISARLYHTFGADGLRVELAKGQRAVLLWLPRPNVYAYLCQLLSAELGNRLTVQ